MRAVVESFCICKMAGFDNFGLQKRFVKGLKMMDYFYKIYPDHDNIFSEQSQ